MADTRAPKFLPTASPQAILGTKIQEKDSRPISLGLLIITSLSKANPPTKVYLDLSRLAQSDVLLQCVRATASMSGHVTLTVTPIWLFSKYICCYLFMAMIDNGGLLPLVYKWPLALIIGVSTKNQPVTVRWW